MANNEWYNHILTIYYIYTPLKNDGLRQLIYNSG